MAQKKKPSGGAGSTAKPARASATAGAGQTKLRQPRISDRAAKDSGQAVSSEAGMKAAATTAGAVHGAAPLPLGSSLSIREVGERAAQLKALFAAGSAEVDAGQLESVDTAGLQLLLAAAAAARRRGLTLKLLGAERLNAGAAGALGLAEHLAAAAKILP